MIFCIGPWKVLGYLDLVKGRPSKSYSPRKALPFNIPLENSVKGEKVSSLHDKWKIMCSSTNPPISSGCPECKPWYS